MGNKVRSSHVKVRRRWQPVGFGLTPVDDEQLVAACEQVVDDGPADEPGAAQDDDAHLRPGSPPEEIEPCHPGAPHRPAPGAR